MRVTLMSAVLLAGAMTAATVPAVLAGEAVQLGPRPYYLVDKMTDSALKDRLDLCAATTKKFRKQVFSIGHRGAPLQFPEHTEESYRAAARMGAGILECDVTFTSDAELVCRHAECDLHTTTNILDTPLAAKCSVPFTPATFDPVTGERLTRATARCCASALTLEEFKSLEGKMDAADPNATTVAEYLGGTAAFRTDLYTTGGTLLSHKESIELFKELGTGMTPELKSITDNAFPGGQKAYARKMVQEYIDAGIRPQKVWAQSFNYDDVLQWIAEFPRFGLQAVFLDGRYDRNIPKSDFISRRKEGLNIIAPPQQILLKAKPNGKIVPSKYAKRARQAGLDIISWTTERSGRIVEDVIAADGAFYYDELTSALENDGDILRVIDVLAKDVGIIGLFSDWPATTTFYANCEL